MKRENGFAVGVFADSSLSWGSHLICASGNAVFFHDSRGRHLYTCQLNPETLVFSHVTSSGWTLVVTLLSLTCVPPPLHAFRARLRARETAKLWAYLKQSYALKSRRLRGQAWAHCLELLSNKDAPVERRGVQRYDPSAKKR